MNNLLNLLIFLLFLTGCNSREFPPVKKIEDFKQTEFIPTLEQKLDLNKNQIYCSTLLYAWDEIRKELKNNIKIEKKYNQLLMLNSSKSFQNSLSKDEIKTSIEIEEGIIRASAVFDKSLPFMFDFKRDNFDLIFNKSNVQSFGVNGYDNDISPQLKLIYYQNQTEFALKISPKDSEHEILLFMLPTDKNYSFTQMLNRLKDKIEYHKKVKINEKNSWRYDFSSEDILSIPILTFNLENNYQKLEGNSFLSNDKTYSVDRAYQRIAFILDEKGAKVESEALFETSTDSMGENFPKPKKMIFDKPFLILLKRVNADNPYLAMWIVNDELMIKK